MGRSTEGAPPAEPVDTLPLDLLAAPPGWRDRFDDLTGGLASRFPPGLVALALAAIAVAVVLVLRSPAGGDPVGELPLAPSDLEGGAAVDGKAGVGPTVEGPADGEASGPGPPGPGARGPDGGGDAGEVTAHAAGAVVAPGVHTLPAGSRLADLVAAAGGTTADADLDRVNLAAPVVDGSRVWVPRRGGEVPALVDVEVPPGAPAAGSGSGGPSTGGSAAPGAAAPPVRLSTATPAELEALPGVGPATAAAIVAHRDANGPFRSVDDLLEVRGIGPAKLEQIRPLAVP